KTHNLRARISSWIPPYFGRNGRGHLPRSGRQQPSPVCSRAQAGNPRRFSLSRIRHSDKPGRPVYQPSMGRIFETRKATMFARWNRMAKAFTRISKDIAIAVKAGGANPDSNPALRRAIQNAKAANMPKDKVEAAIRRASGQEQAAYETVLYEGYGPHGIA